MSKSSEKERLKTIFYRLIGQNRKIVIAQEEALLFAQKGSEGAGDGMENRKMLPEFVEGLRHREKNGKKAAHRGGKMAPGGL